MPAPLVADRFLRDRDRWFDLASGDPVSLVISAAGTLREQIAWAERCMMLARLRHSLINPLIDFGVASATSFFEAYAILDAIASTPQAFARLSAHARRFLDAHGVTIAAKQASIVFREPRRGTGSRRRPIGFTLQPRRAFESVQELLASAPHGGLTRVSIAGPEGSGLRTLQTMAAQVARQEGYVPVCPTSLARWPYLVDYLRQRHVCVLLPADGPLEAHGVCSSFLARLAIASARPHVCLSFERSDLLTASAIHLTSMGTKSMTSMLHVDWETGPSCHEVFEAARDAGGLPGKFLARLCGQAFEPSAPRAFTVHETPAVFGPSLPAVEVSNGRPSSRIGTVLWRASTRATAMEKRGRHAAAARLLDRAGRVLEGRGNAMQAAHCWRALAWMLRGRGAIERALTCAERAQRIALTADAQAAAALIVSVCRTDEQRFVEAESSLRTLIVAADVAGDPILRAQCQIALARVFCHTGRYHEALTLADGLATAREPALACDACVLQTRAYAGLGAMAEALKASRDAVAYAEAAGDLRFWTKVHYASAQAHRLAGDLNGVRGHAASGLRSASAAHRPLAGLRIRALLLTALQEMHGPRGEIEKLRRALDRALRGPVPPLVRSAVEAACRGAAPRSSVAPSSRSLPLEHFLELAHRAHDDRSAINSILDATLSATSSSSSILVLCEGRTLAAAGRAWRERSSVAAQASASGLVVGVGAAEPPEAAVPIRCGGDLLGALACRWVAGTAVAPAAIDTMKAAAMAMASAVRIVTETTIVEAAPASTDLLGESPLASALREAVQRASRAPFPVLIEGESGSGKELVARAIHKYSPRHMRRFCAINCAALSDELLEAELFGHTRGAFTGATAERAGLFEEADGGTLFLDEVGELSARAQAKLLRVLQEGEVRRVGENMPRRVDVRIVAATNRRLAQEASEGRFRVDLRFRLDVLRIVVPPLRDRFADIPLLAQHFWRQATARVGSTAVLGADVLAALSRHDWPGNVRELQNVIAWTAVHAPRRGRVSASLLPAHIVSRQVPATGSFEAARADFERRFVRAALAQAGGRRLAAAQALGLSRQGLSKMLRRLGIEDEEATSGG